jgi:hypothetical protein
VLSNKHVRQLECAVVEKDDVADFFKFKHRERIFGGVLDHHKEAVLDPLRFVVSLQDDLVRGALFHHGLYLVLLIGVRGAYENTCGVARFQLVQKDEQIFEFGHEPMKRVARFVGYECFVVQDEHLRLRFVAHRAPSAVFEPCVDAFETGAFRATLHDAWIGHVLKADEAVLLFVESIGQLFAFFMDVLSFRLKREQPFVFLLQAGVLHQSHRVYFRVDMGDGFVEIAQDVMYDVAVRAHVFVRNALQRSCDVVGVQMTEHHFVHQAIERDVLDGHFAVYFFDGVVDSKRLQTFDNQDVSPVRRDLIERMGLRLGRMNEPIELCLYDIDRFQIRGVTKDEFVELVSTQDMFVLLEQIVRYDQYHCVRDQGVI